MIGMVQVAFPEKKELGVAEVEALRRQVEAL